MLSPSIRSEQIAGLKDPESRSEASGTKGELELVKLEEPRTMPRTSAVPIIKIRTLRRFFMNAKPASWRSCVNPLQHFVGSWLRCVQMSRGSN